VNRAVIITLSSLSPGMYRTLLTSLTPMITSLVGSSLRQLLNVLALNGVIEGEKERKRTEKEERRRRFLKKN
jgi:hypothetical protein